MTKRLLFLLTLLLLPGVVSAQTQWGFTIPAITNDLRLYESTFTNYVGLHAPNSVTTYDCSVPGTLGSVNQALTISTTSPCALSWATPSGSGTVTTTGSPANGNLTKFSGATSITNGDLSGDVTTSGTLVTAIAANAVTLAKLATQADGTVLANISGGTAVPTAATITTVMDKLLGTTQGSVMYRNATTWVALTPGTSGQFLQTQGAAANVIWATPAGAGTVTHTAGALTAGQLIQGNAGADITVGDLSGDVSTSGSLVTTIGANKVTLAKLATQANNTILANVSGGAATPAADTLSAILDSILGTTQGAIIYRNASIWTILSPGTAGQVLQSGGASANVLWGSVGGGSVTTTGSPVSGNLTKFSGATSITNGDLSGDVTTSGTLVATLAATGVSNGIYGQVQVDTKGRVTAGTIIADVTHGGTGVNVLPANSIPIGAGTSPVTTVAAGGANTVLHGASPPSYSRVSLGSGANTSGDIVGNLPVLNLNNGTSAGPTTFWRGDGTWATPSLATPAAPVTSVQFNNSGIFGGDANMTWDATNHRLALGGVTPGYQVQANGAFYWSGTGPSVATFVTLQPNEMLAHLVYGGKTTGFLMNQSRIARSMDADNDIGINIYKDETTGGISSVGVGVSHLGLGTGDNFFAQTTTTATEWRDGLFRGDISGSAPPSGGVGPGAVFMGNIFSTADPSSYILWAREHRSTVGNAGSLRWEAEAITTGTAFALVHVSSAWVGDGIFLNFAAGSGSYSGNPIHVAVSSSNVFLLDGLGDLTIKGGFSTGNVGNPGSGGVRASNTIRSDVGFNVNGTAGLSTTVTVGGGTAHAGADCTLIYTGGVYTGGTC